VNVEVRHGALYPDDEPGAIGLLFAVDLDDGERVTVVVDPEWLRTLLSGIGAGADLGWLKVPEEVMLPIAAGGWDDDWDHTGRAEMDRMGWLFNEAGRDWARLRQAVDVLTGLEEPREVE
jgi:hypothetical protein